ncbi:hypothetical protein DIPPA_03009 [Diplonema papillatum]|nr:hypothetical protein DIPPA_03009 [Diplonema papillatum]
MPRLGQRLRPIDPRENKAKCSLPDIGALLSKRNERKRQSQATKQKLVESLKVRYPPESSAQILGKFLYAPVETTEARGALHVSENRPVEDVIAINKKLFERFAEECARESASQLPEDVQAGLLGYDPSAQKPSFRFQMPTTQAYNERTARFKVSQKQQQQQQQKIPSIWDRASQRLEHEEAEKKRCIAAYMRLLFYLAAITAPTSQGQVDVVRAFRELLLTERRVTKRLFFDLLLDVGPRVFASRENMKIVHFLRIELNVSNTSLLRFVKKYRDIGWHIPRELATQLDLNQSKSMRSK